MHGPHGGFQGSCSLVVFERLIFCPPLQGLLPNDFANRVKVCVHPCDTIVPACARTSRTTSGLCFLQIAELNRHIDNMHQREDEYRRRVQVWRGHETILCTGCKACRAAAMRSLPGVMAPCAQSNRCSQISWRRRARTEAKPSRSCTGCAAPAEHQHLCTHLLTPHQIPRIQAPD